MEANTYPKSSDVLESAVLGRYGQEIRSGLVSDSNQLLAMRIEREALELGNSIINRIPSQFDHSNPDLIEAIPQYQFPAWKTLSNNFDLFGIKGGALWLQPAAWQFAYAFHHICRAHKLFVAYGDIYNIPVAVEVLRQAKTKCVVTSEAVARGLKKELEAAKISGIIELAIIARDVREASSAPAEFGFNGANTLWEIQVFPGHTIAYQSFALSGQRNAFHLSEDYLWRFEADATYITGISADVLPLFNYKLPVKVVPTASKASLAAFSFLYD